MKNRLIKYILAILSLIAISNIASYSQSGNCKLTFDGSNYLISGRTNASSIKPGDTICLNGNWQNLKISYLHGTNAAPIVIQNQNAQVLISGFYYGLKIDSCSHIKFSGGGNTNIQYGIKIYNINGFGISVEGLSTYIEIEKVEISNTVSAGIYAKTDVDTANFNSTRDKYTMRNTVIHDCYFHHIGNEGFYVGSSKYTGDTFYYHGKDTLVYPHVLKGVNIYNNRVEYTGWDGIQVSSADSGCYVHDNFIYRDSESSYNYQMTGIMFGSGSNCDCYNNIIKDGKGDGIDIFGLGGQKIYNNLIIRPGRTYYPDSTGYFFNKHGIYRGQSVTISGLSDIIAYNTIISPRNFGVIYSNYITKNNLIANNIITNPGSYPDWGEKAFIRAMDIGMEIIDLNNIKYLNSSQIEFLDMANDNFDLKKTSPAVNTAVDILSLDLTQDILKRSRPFSTDNDIGAYECHDSSLLSIGPDPQILKEFEILAIKYHTNGIEIQYKVNISCNLIISLLNSTGVKILDSTETFVTPSTNTVNIGNSKLSPGLYFCSFSTKKWTITKKIIIK